MKTYTAERNVIAFLILLGFGLMALGVFGQTVTTSSGKRLPWPAHVEVSGSVVRTILPDSVVTWDMDQTLRGNPGISCEVINSDMIERNSDANSDMSELFPKSARCVRLYWEVAHELYLNKGGQAGTLNYMAVVWNNFAAVMAANNIDVTLSELFIWDTPDPFTATSTFSRLTQFSQYRTTFNGNIAHLIGLNGGGGVAYLDVLCSNSTPRTAYSAIGTTLQAYPAYSWTVYVLAHETGHNLGSPHTHACAWNGNNTAYDGCGPSVGYSEGTCDPGPLPGFQQGTIMSYCHLVSGVGINLALGYGDQPGNLIQNRIQTATCLTLDCNGEDACLAPDPVTIAPLATYANISWPAVAPPGDGYTVRHRQWGATAWTSVNTFNTFTNITGLQPLTMYEVQVSTNCDGLQPAWSGIYEFTTQFFGCVGDAEPNNTPQTFQAVTTSTIGKITEGDVDWYGFSTNRKVRVTVTGTPVTIMLHRRQGQQVIAVPAVYNAAGTVAVYNNVPNGNTQYRVLVSGTPSELCYTLTVETSITPFPVPEFAQQPIPSASRPWNGIFNMIGQKTSP